MLYPCNANQMLYLSQGIHQKNWGTKAFIVDMAGKQMSYDVKKSCNGIGTTL